MTEINTMSIRLLIFCLSIFSLSSCTNYQYIHLSSDLPRTSDSEHYYLSDSSIYVDFDFSGNHFPIELYFLNESAQPIFIDLTETLFFEDDFLVSNAFQLTGQSLEERILIPAGKGAAFQFRPYQSEYLPLVKAQSNYVELFDGTRKESAIGKSLSGSGRNFEILITYRMGEENGEKVSMSAKFKEEYIYFTSREPEFFPSGTSPYCYYISESNQSGQIAASLLFEVASASLYYLMLESLD